MGEARKIKGGSVEAVITMVQVEQLESRFDDGIKVGVQDNGKESWRRSVWRVVVISTPGYPTRTGAAIKEGKKLDGRIFRAGACGPHGR